MSDWSKIEALPFPNLVDLFADEPDRLEMLSLDVAGIHFDWSKTHLTKDAIAAFEELAAAQDLTGKRAAMFGGEHVNVTEDRPVEHTAERYEGNADSVARARKFHERMRALIDAIEGGALGEIRSILHVGIGGSALGPHLLVDALGREDSRYDVAIVSNVDGVALEDVFVDFDPETTLLVVASKTFTTTETMLNASSVIQWMTDHGVADPYGRVVALTANPDRAVEWGVDETRVLPFGGGRRRAPIRCGRLSVSRRPGPWLGRVRGTARGRGRDGPAFPPDAVGRERARARGVCDLYYTQVRHAETRAPFAYDERLQLLPSYLQQLEMESIRQGRARRRRARRSSDPQRSPGAGSAPMRNMQCFQLLHQGTHLVPVEFIAVIEAGDTLDEAHHRQLLPQRVCAGRGADEG